MKGHEQLCRLFMAKSGWYHGASQASVPGLRDGGFLFCRPLKAVPALFSARKHPQRTPEGTPAVFYSPATLLNNRIEQPQCE